MNEADTTEYRCCDYAELKDSTSMNDEQIKHFIELGIIEPVMNGNTQLYRYDPEELWRLHWNRIIIKMTRAALGY